MIFTFGGLLLGALILIWRESTAEQRAADRAYEVKLKGEARDARNAARKLKDPKELGWFDLLDPR